MITDKMIMPILMASQHPMIHVALLMAGMIVKNSYITDNG